MSAIEGALKKVFQVSFVGGGLWGIQKSCLFTVDGGERAVMFNRFALTGPAGIQKVAYADGTHFMIPWVQTPHVIDVKARPKFEKAVTATKDLQQVNIGVRILHRPKDVALPEVFQKYGLRYDERILPSIMNEVMKTKVAEYNAEELLTKRERVSSDIKLDLERRAGEFGLELQDVSITALTFGSEFAKAIEQKQVAEQEAERAKFIVQQREHERSALVIEAEAETEAASLIQAAMASGSGVVQLRKIEACKEIAENLAKSRNVVYLPSGGSNILLGVSTGQ